ncbi:MAG: hypothetical protein JEZ02_03930 [Desulfatibacillum sp.]|nr:hypothetical protein [Desulfatibacillum sp.]
MSVKKLLVLMGVVLLLGANAFARDAGNNTLLDMLQSKGLLTAEELQTIRNADSSGLNSGSNTRDIVVEILHKKGVLSDQEVAQIRRNAGVPPNAPGEVPSPALTNKDTGKELVGSLDNGFCLKTRDETAEFHLKGLLQADYKAYDYDLEPVGIGTDPGTDKFDIRRARLITTGKLSPFFNFRLSYEFQGAGSRRLLDAYVDARIHDAFSLRLGQFKEPFGLEALSSDSNLFFTERSMGFDLNPNRDVGVMAFGDFYSGAVYYRAGLFNGDGLDDASGGNVDEPEVCARIGLSPFAFTEIPLIEGIHLGASGSYIRTDLNNVRLGVSTAGGTEFFSVSSHAKFNIIRNCDTRIRHGADAAWTYGPVALFGEYIQAQYNDIKTSALTFDAEMTDIYGAAAWMITGEPIRISRGMFQPIIPEKSLGEGGFGALGIAFRYDTFDAGDKVYDTLVYMGDSVREVESMTLGLNWYLNQYARLSLEATRTSFDKPLLIYRDSATGTSLYSDKEDTIISRFQLGF